MRSFFFLIINALITLSASAANLPVLDLNKPDFNILLPLTPSERTSVLFEYFDEYVYNQDSITLYRDIGTLQKLAKRHQDPHLHLMGDLIEAHYYAYRYDHVVPLMKSKLLAISQKAQTQKALWLEARVESLLGTRLYGMGDYEGGFLHLTKAVKLLEKEDPELYPIKQICLYLLAHAHFTFKEYQIAAPYFKEALLASSKFDRYYYYMHILNELAYCFRKLGMLDSSNHYFERTLQRAIEARDTLWQVVSLGNLGENLFLAGAFAQAEPLIRQDADFAIASNNPGAAANALSLLGDMAMKQGQMLKAKILLKEAQQMAWLSDDIKRLQLVYPLLAKLYASQLEPEKAAMYMDSAFLINEQVEKEFDYIKSARAEQQLEREESNVRMAKLESERAVKIAERNAVMALLIALATLAFVLFSKLHKRNVKNKKQLQNTTTALEAARAQLQQFTAYLAEKNQQLEALQEQAGESANQSLNELQDKTILTEEDWENFKKLFDQVYPGYLKRALQKHPSLSQAELRYIALSKMALNAKQMAAVLGVGDSSIRQVRSRLKRKLGLESAEQFEALISSI